MYISSNFKCQLSLKKINLINLIKVCATQSWFWSAEFCFFSNCLCCYRCSQNLDYPREISLSWLYFKALLKYWLFAIRANTRRVTSKFRIVLPKIKTKIELVFVTTLTKYIKQLWRMFIIDSFYSYKICLFLGLLFITLKFWTFSRKRDFQFQFCIFFLVYILYALLQFSDVSSFIPLIINISF